MQDTRQRRCVSSWAAMEDKTGQQGGKVQIVQHTSHHQQATVGVGCYSELSLTTLLQSLLACLLACLFGEFIAVHGPAVSLNLEFKMLQSQAEMRL